MRMWNWLKGGAEAQKNIYQCVGTLAFFGFLKSRGGKGQLISKRLLEKIVWTKIATKKFDNFCPGGQIKKIKAL